MMSNTSIVQWLRRETLAALKERPFIYARFFLNVIFCSIYIITGLLLFVNEKTRICSMKFKDWRVKADFGIIFTTIIVFSTRLVTSVTVNIFSKVIEILV